MKAPTLRDWLCQVTENEACGHNLKRLRLQPMEGRFQCAPGQFVMLDLPLEAFHFRRPFSILSVQSDGSFDVYYKRVGKGTQRLWDLRPGEQVRALGPLGNCFEPACNQEHALLIGGGIGIAPLYHWALNEQQAGRPTGHCFYGVRSQDEIGLNKELSSLLGENWHLATDDGSAGQQGNVCDLLNTQKQLVRQASHAYICGPSRMMQAVTQLLEQLNPELRMYVSLEERMPCGTGACTGCVVPHRDQALPSKVCSEGPIFDARTILWQNESLTTSCVPNLSTEAVSCSR